MSQLHDTLAKKIPDLRRQRAALVEKHGDAKITDVSVRQIVRGMRDVSALVCDTSVVDPDKGLVIRGTPVAHLADRLPEEVFYLLLTGNLPDVDELRAMHEDLAKRATTPSEVWDVVEAMPADAHPMAMLSAALLAMENRSVFRSRYEAGMDREDYWQPALDDALTAIAVLPEIVAGIYRMRYQKGERIVPDPQLDWAANLVHMLGNDDDAFCRYMRLATVLKSDHEGGHTSALAAHAVGSVLSDVYYVLSAGFDALAGPLHGLASQVCLHWVVEAMNRYGGQPSDDQIREYTWETIEAGRVIPGYGHAVLRGQDPRYLAILAFGEENTPRDPVFKTVTAMSRVVPSVLIEHGKVKNPWPNVDAINGALFHHYGVTEIPFYTVFFAAALSFGVSAQYVLNRALGTPITRPRSVSTEWLKKQVR
jgi:citrate synthase